MRTEAFCCIEEDTGWDFFRNDPTDDHFILRAKSRGLPLAISGSLVEFRFLHQRLGEGLAEAKRDLARRPDPKQLNLFEERTA